MRSVLLMIVVALATMLLGAVLTDWLHSLANSETVVLVRGDRIYAIDNVGGQISFWKGKLTLDGQIALPDGWYHEHWEPPNMRVAQEFNVVNPEGEDLWLLGFALTTQRRFPTTVRTVTYGEVLNTMGFVVPLWAPILLFAVLVILCLKNLRRRARRNRVGLCTVCGYDLRASIDRCPECGTAIAAANPSDVAWAITGQKPAATSV